MAGGASVGQNRRDTNFRSCPDSTPKLFRGLEQIIRPSESQFSSLKMKIIISTLLV